MFKELVVIDGVDGSGKSSVIKELSIKLGATIIESPSGEFRNIKHVFDNPIISQKSRYLFYLSCLVETSNLIEIELKRGKGVLADRYLHSVMAYPLAEKEDISFVSIDRLKLYIPFRTICLTAEDDIRINRIIKRDGKNEAIKAIERLEHIKKIDKLLKSWADFTIDTSNLVVNQTVNRIYEYLQAEGGL